MNAISSLIPTLLRQLQPGPDLTEQLVISLWKCAVGQTLARNTRPTRLHQSTLIVSVPSQSWRKELFALRFEILRKLTQILGEQKVLALEFRVDPRMIEPIPRCREKEAALDPDSAPLQWDAKADPELGRSLSAAAASYFNRVK